MNLIRPQSISAIDRYVIETMKISEEGLIFRAADAIASAIETRAPRGEVLILCGGGNNGADGYATAIRLRQKGISALAVDVFAKGQRSEGGQAVLRAYREIFGDPLRFEDLACRKEPFVIVDAMLGSGCVGELSPLAKKAGEWIASQAGFKVAVDLPLGVDGDLGEVQQGAVRVDMTVVLSFMKRGLLSYPARAYCGELLYADLGINAPELLTQHTAAYAVDDTYMLARLPVRKLESHKGTFGKTVIFAGSQKYCGAAQLCALGALRLGAGLTSLVSEADVTRMVCCALPELLVTDAPPFSAWGEAEIMRQVENTVGANVVVVGPGCAVSEGLFRFVSALLGTEGCPVLLDADALNAVAQYAKDSIAFFAAAKRAVMLTPHPLEFGRLCGLSAAQVQSKRMRYAMDYAQRAKVSLLLKGAGTVITDGERLFLNTSGCSALAKGGSGDVLAGAVAALVAQGSVPTDALAIAAYLHGEAGEVLSHTLSEYGVIPSDLPAEMARLIAKKQKKQRG